MASDATLEMDDPISIAVERPRSDGLQHRLERRILCDRIQELQQELERERRRRRQIVEQYERMLSERDGKTTEKDGRSDLLTRFL